jgi:nifR3 family TIM-barrel protein
MTRIGKLTLDAPFFQAGLAGYSDAAMRLVARRHGAPYAITEAMLDMFLINGGKGVRAAELYEQDHPIAGQLMGSNPADIARGAKVLVSLGYDVIDVNLACPVKKIRKKCRGGHLMQAPDEAIAILDAVRQAVPSDIPCSVKLRRGTDDSPEALANFHRIFRAVIHHGYAAATVHGRTVVQKYLGPSNWQFLRDLTNQYGHTENFAIFGSGDIWTAHDVFRMIKETGVKGVSVARGCIGNPWIFTQARAIMAGDESGATLAPTVEQQRDVLLDHFRLAIGLHGERMGSMMMRKFGIKFARHHPQPDAVAKAFIAVHSLPDWLHVLSTHYGAAQPEAIAEVVAAGAKAQAKWDAAGFANNSDPQSIMGACNDNEEV